MITALDDCSHWGDIARPSTGNPAELELTNEIRSFDFDDSA
jgi:hypothetical protein